MALNTFRVWHSIPLEYGTQHNATEQALNMTALNTKALLKDIMNKFEL